MQQCASLRSMARKTRTDCLGMLLWSLYSSHTDTNTGHSMEPRNTALRIFEVKSVTTRIAASYTRLAKKARTPTYKTNRSPEKWSQNRLEASQYPAGPLPSRNPSHPLSPWRGSPAVTPQIVGKAATSMHLHYPLQPAGATSTLLRQLRNHVAPVKLPDHRLK